MLIRVNEVLNRFKSARLRDDGAESSIMNVISQNIAALLLIPIGAVVTVLVIGSISLTSDAGAQASMKVASDQFTSDVNGATEIIPLNTTTLAALSSNYLASDQTRLSNSDVATRAGTLVPLAQRSCRISIWNIAGSTTRTIQNIIIWKSGASCDPSTGETATSINSLLSSIPSTASISTLIRAAAADTIFRYYNTAGREITFTGVGTPSAPLTTSDPTFWYTDAEWVQNTVKRVDLKVDTALKVTGTNKVTFTATTNLVLPELTDNPVTVVPPTAIVFVPDPVTGIVVTRCSVAHPGVANPGGLGFFECIDVSWTPTVATQCGTYSPVYSVTVTNQATGRQTDTIVSGLSAPSTYIGGVWNGDSYNVVVTSQCSGSGDGPSTPSTVPFDQSLPSPRPVVTFGATEATHILNWNATTSDPTVNYEVSYQPYGSALTYTKQTELGTNPSWYWLPQAASGTWTPQTVSPSTALTATYTGRTIRPGFPDSYRIRASTVLPPGVDTTRRLTSPWGYASVIYSINLTGPPTVTVTGSESSPTVVTQNTGSPSTLCPAGVSTSYAYESHQGKNGIPVAQWVNLSVSAWGAAASRTDTMNQGSVYIARSILSCYTQFVPLPAITMLSQDAYNQNLTNDTDSVKDSTAINRANEATTIQQPNSAGRQNNSALSVWKWYVRPITTPGLPSSLYASVPGYGLGDSSVVNWTGASCGTGPIGNYDSQFVNVNGTTGVWADRTGTASSISTVNGEASGSYYGWQVREQCMTNLPPIDLPTPVTALQQSVWSGFAGSWFVSNVRGPSVAASNNTGSIYAGQSYSVNFTVTCSTGNNPVGATNPTYWDTAATGYSPNPTYFWRSGRTYSGYCQGAWGGVGAMNSAAATANPGWVSVRNPNPPAPSTPTSCGPTIFQVGSNGMTLNRLTVACTGSAYATSYEAYAVITWAGSGGQSNTGTISSTSSTIVLGACYSNPGFGIVSIDGAMRAIGPGGTSAWNNFNLPLSSASRVLACA